MNLQMQAALLLYNNNARYIFSELTNNDSVVQEGIDICLLIV